MSSQKKRTTLFPLVVQVTPKKGYLSLPEKQHHFSLSDISETVAGITYSKTLRLLCSGLLFLASVDFTLLSTSDCKEFDSIFRARNSQIKSPSLRGMKKLSGWALPTSGPRTSSVTTKPQPLRRQGNEISKATQLPTATKQIPLSQLSAPSKYNWWNPVFSQTEDALACLTTENLQCWG